MTFDLDALKHSSFGDRYEVIEILGQGGMGAVLKARQLSLGKLVAIKVLNPVFLADAASRKRFELEAQAGSTLNHPNLISVLDFGYTQAGEPYLVMEFVDGAALDSMLENGRPRAEEFLPIIIQVCKALRYLHQSNIIHRDLKPGNIMVADIAGERYAKLVDLGIAKVVSTDGNPTQHLTSTGAVFGSPLYMSPEQCRGEKVDPRSDIYSLGCVMYECLIGDVPFIGENPLQTLQKHLHEAPAPIPCSNEIEYELAGVTTRCLQKDRAHRFQDVGELLNALSSVEARLRTEPRNSAPAQMSLQQQLDAIPTPKATFAPSQPFGNNMPAPGLQVQDPLSLKVPDGQGSLPLHRRATGQHSMPSGNDGQYNMPSGPGPSHNFGGPSAFPANAGADPNAGQFRQYNQGSNIRPAPTNLSDVPLNDLAKEFLSKAFIFSRDNKYIVALGVVAFVIFWYWWQAVSLGFQINRNFETTRNSLEQLNRAQEMQLGPIQRYQP